MQSTGHGCVLQLRSVQSAGQVRPPFNGAMTIVRERDCVQPPHSSVHVENASGVQAFTPGARHGSQDPDSIWSEYRKAPHLEQTNGGYT